MRIQPLHSNDPASPPHFSQQQMALKVQKCQSTSISPAGCCMCLEKHSATADQSAHFSGFSLGISTGEMGPTQLFRLDEKSATTEEIRCSQVDGINVIFWEDIEQVFPGVQYVKNGNVTISPMRDSNRNRTSLECDPLQRSPG
ncbi:MAG: hypothetical protein J3Q66DRAFT_388025 [Benniella sp.]|nr:MAG: hypothetical protein J3Q66DRAFT_388025 [Benniella sp.]